MMFNWDAVPVRWWLFTVEGVAFDEIFWFAQDAIFWGGEIGAVISVECSAKTSESIVEFIVDYCDLGAFSIVDYVVIIADLNFHFLVGEFVDLDVTTLGMGGLFLVVFLFLLVNQDFRCSRLGGFHVNFYQFALGFWGTSCDLNFLLLFTAS